MSSLDQWKSQTQPQLKFLKAALLTFPPIELIGYLAKCVQTPWVGGPVVTWSLGSCWISVYLSERSAQQRSIIHRRVKCFDAGEESAMEHAVWEHGPSERTEWQVEVQVLKGVCPCKSLSLVSRHSPAILSPRDSSVLWGRFCRSRLRLAKCDASSQLTMWAGCCADPRHCFTEKMSFGLIPF